MAALLNYPHQHRMDLNKCNSIILNMSDTAFSLLLYLKKFSFKDLTWHSLRKSINFQKKFVGTFSFFPIYTKILIFSLVGGVTAAEITDN
jgi:hypothetical protein